jgi:hypothetical protein
MSPILHLAACRLVSASSADEAFDLRVTCNGRTYEVSAATPSSEIVARSTPLSRGIDAFLRNLSDAGELDIEVEDDGVLRVYARGGREELVVRPRDDVEAWEIVSDQGLLAVAVAGGGATLWMPRDPPIDSHAPHAHDRHDPA